MKKEKTEAKEKIDDFLEQKYVEEQYLNDNFRKFEVLKENVILWADEKGIFEKGNPLAQAEKGIEEANELKDAIFADENGLSNFYNSKQQLCNTKNEIKDAIGDRLITLIISSKFADLDILDCLESAYKIISNRKGEMVDGTFVKDE